MSSSEVALVSTRRGKPSLIVDGYRYRLHRKNDEVCSWLCVKEKSEKCRGSVKTSHSKEIIARTYHKCVPNLAETEVEMKLEQCRKRVRDELLVPVNEIYNDEMKDLYARGYDFVVELPKYENRKSNLCKIRRKQLGSEQNPKLSEDVVFPSELLLLPDGSSFLKIDDADTESRILVFAGEEAKYLLEEGTTFFMDGTFSSCAQQFQQLYTLHVDLNSTKEETRVVPVLYALLPGKTEATYSRLLSLVKIWCPGWCPKLIKMDFEVAVWKAVKKAFPSCEISGCNFHFNQCLWRKVQELGLTVTYKNDENVRLTIKMCASLALIPLELVEEGWISIMAGEPKDEKLTKFLDYFVEQWLENHNVPVSSWNVCGQRHRTNNAVEGWNNKINTIMGKKHPNVFLLIQKLKQNAIEGAFLKRKFESGETAVKRRKNFIQRDERIESVLQQFNHSQNLKKCLHALSFQIKLK